jgi:hypothetical protein
MRNAAILKYDTVVVIDDFLNPEYDIDSGFLVSFILNSIRYKHTLKENFRQEDVNSMQAGGGYYNEEMFLKYLAGEVPIDIITSNKYKLSRDKIELAKSGDIINIQKIKIVPPNFDEFCKVEKTKWIYDASVPLIANFNIIVPTNASSKDIVKSLDVNAFQFYNNKILLVRSQEFSEDKSQAALIISKIAILINNISVQIFRLFNDTPNFNSYIEAQTLDWSFGNIFNSNTLEGFNEYFNNLNSYYKAVYSNQRVIEKANNDEKLYWLVCCLSANGLAIIPVNKKIQVLKFIALKGVQGEISTFFSKKINNEEVVLNIFYSISTAQTEEFLSSLVQEKIYNPKEDSYKSLYERIYEETQDKYFGLGEANRHKLVTQLYLLWFTSSYNPAVAYDLTSNNYQATQSLAETYSNKPVTIEYNSRKSFGFYLDDYGFLFENNQINVLQKVVRYQETIPNYGNDYATYKEVTSMQNIGSFDIFQPISLKDIQNSEFAVKIPTIAIEGNDTAIIPLFFLKYMDDYGDREDFFTALNLAFDVALTFTGIGNITKLRYLRHTTKLGRLFLGQSFPAGERILVLEGLSVAGGLVELTASVASIILQAYTGGCTNYINQVNEIIDDEHPDASIPDCEEVTPGNEQYCFCRNLDKWLFWVQIASGSTDLVSSLMVRNASRKIIKDGVPSGFDPDAYDVILRFAGDLTEIKTVFTAKLDVILGTNSSTLQKLNALDEIKQREFIWDFGKVDTLSIKALDNEGDSLVDIWSGIKRIKNKKRDLKYLKDLKFIRSSEDLKKEIFIGDVIPPNTPPRNNTSKWKANGVHHIKALESGGIARIEPGTSIIPVGPQGLGYYVAKIQLYDEGFGGWKVKSSKGGLSTFFPDWDEDVVLEEIALAYLNKKSKGGRLYKGRMSDNQYCSFFIENNKITTAHPSFKK